jgi:hypothetical protein
MNKNIYPALFFVLSILALVACGQRQNRESATEGNVVEAARQRGFRQISIPDSLVLPEDRAAYLVTRYWDNFDFSDTTYIHLPHITERAFVDFLSILPHTEKEKANAAIVAMLTRTIAEDATGKMYVHFLDLFQKYLHDPNSPLRNEEFYITVAEFIIGTPVSDFVTKERARFDLSRMLINRVGTVANDFQFVTIDNVGGLRSLHSLLRTYTILYFHNPGCPACEEASRFLHNSPIINHLLNIGSLDILAVYTDENLDLWEQSRHHIHPFWINARDEPRIIINQSLYDLRAIPSLYLLDRDKVVLLKDADVRAIEAHLIRSEEERRAR